MPLKLVLVLVVSILTFVACGSESEPASPTLSPTASLGLTSEPALTFSPTVASSPLASACTPTPYTVQPGDSLSVIAASFSVTLDALMQANSIADADLIVVGEVLQIPCSEEGATPLP